MFIAGALQRQTVQCWKDVCEKSGDYERGLCKDDGFFEAAWSSAARKFPEADVSACHVRAGMETTEAATNCTELSS
jgi:hypothetical protein